MAQRNTVNTHMLLNMIKGIYKSVEREWDEYAQKYGMTNAHLHVLWILSINDGLKLSELASKGVWNLSTTHDIVTRMASKGLVRKEKDMEDGRVTRVYITREGKLLRDKTQEYLDDGYKFKLLKAIESLSEADRLKFYSIMEQIAKQTLDSDFIQYIRSSTEKLTDEDESDE